MSTDPTPENPASKVAADLCAAEFSRALEQFRFKVRTVQFQSRKDIQDTAAAVEAERPKGREGTAKFKLECLRFKRLNGHAINQVQEQIGDVDVPFIRSVSDSYSVLRYTLHQLSCALSGRARLAFICFKLDLEKWILEGQELGGIAPDSDLPEPPAILWVPHDLIRFTDWYGRGDLMRDHVTEIIRRFGSRASLRNVELDQATVASKPRIGAEKLAILTLLRGLPKYGALTGKHICNSLEDAGIIMSESALTTHHIPLLREHFGVRNDPKIGYFIDASEASGD